MADITNLFKATVKTVKIKDKTLANNIDKSILPRTKKSDFAVNAINVVMLITKLKEFLLENRKAYINATGLFSQGKSQMTDLDRDQIDTEAETFMKMCQDAIKQLKVQANNQKVMRQMRENKDSILNLVEKYLITVCRMYSEQKAIRVKRTIDKKRISRLQTEPIVRQTIFDLKQDKNHNGVLEMKKSKNSNEALINGSKEPDVEVLKKSLNHLECEDDDDDENGDSLSKEEKIMLQKENDQLFTEMSTMVDEIKQIEGKIIEISRLQEIFSEKVLDQEKDINKLADTIVGASENIKEANEEIREAMKNNAGFRVWILFFLLVCTFSLLFLDWYNA